MLDFHATPDERKQADALAREDILGNGNAIHDLSVSCYTALQGEDGRPEDVHERKLSDGTCRCGYYSLRKWPVTLTQDGGPGRVDTFTWGASYTYAYSRTVQTVDSDPLWEGWSFEVSRKPV
jgi:hypothetical protein